MNLNQNQADLSQQMQAISQSITKAKGPNCSQQITDTEVQDNICWTCQKELDE